MLFGTVNSETLTVIGVAKLCPHFAFLALLVCLAPFRISNLYNPNAWRKNESLSLRHSDVPHCPRLFRTQRRHPAFSTVAMPLVSGGAELT